MSYADSLENGPFTAGVHLSHVEVMTRASNTSALEEYYTDISEIYSVISAKVESLKNVFYGTDAYIQDAKDLYSGRVASAFRQQQRTASRIGDAADFLPADKLARLQAAHGKQVNDVLRAADAMNKYDDLIETPLVKTSKLMGVLGKFMAVVDIVLAFKTLGRQIKEIQALMAEINGCCGGSCKDPRGCLEQSWFYLAKAENKALKIGMLSVACGLASLAELSGAVTSCGLSLVILAAQLYVQFKVIKDLEKEYTRFMTIAKNWRKECTTANRANRRMIRPKNRRT
jgi:hypothetical protein